MDQRAFVFAARVHSIKGKHCQHITVKNQIMSLGSKQSSLFYFYARPSDGKSKGAVVHYSQHNYLSQVTADLQWSVNQPLAAHNLADILI